MGKQAFRTMNNNAGHLQTNGKRSKFPSPAISLCHESYMSAMHEPEQPSRLFTWTGYVGPFPLRLIGICMSHRLPVAARADSQWQHERKIPQFHQLGLA